VVAIAFPQALTQRGLQDAAVPFIGRTNDARGTGISGASDGILNKFRLRQGSDRLVNDWCDPFHETSHWLRAPCDAFFAQKD
jgi:hypothetical protein